MPLHAYLCRTCDTEQERLVRSIGGRVPDYVPCNSCRDGIADRLPTLHPANIEPSGRHSYRSGK